VPTETKRALIVVRTYPTPAKKGVEVSCTAAVTDRGEWLRLFPVPYRFLSHDQRFRKYQWINVSVEKADGDPRPESYKIRADSIQILGDPLPTDHEWHARKAIVFPLKRHCLCCLKKTLETDGSPTLGLFKPRTIKRLIIDEASEEWDEGQLNILRQARLFGDAPKESLEKVPFTFQYEFTCDHDECKGHTLSCTDWEMGEAWRSWKAEYGDEWEVKFRQRFETEMLGKYDTHFYVGTVHQHPKSWIIVGLFYPPPEPPLPPLFEFMEQA
jgi:hypothetical protein